jgi:hypothetical protein
MNDFSSDSEKFALTTNLVRQLRESLEAQRQHSAKLESELQKTR